MPDGRLRQIAVVLVVSASLIWTVASEHVKALVTPDAAGCPHSSDLPDHDRQAQGREAVLCLVNRERAAHGLPSLGRDPRLEAAAQLHAEDMGRRFFYAHENPDGDDPHRRIRRAGFDGGSTGENIHWGVGANATAARIVRDWMNSPGHRANILRPSFTRIGIGIGYEPPQLGAGPRASVYVQNFGG